MGCGLVRTGRRAGGEGLEARKVPQNRTAAGHAGSCRRPSGVTLEGLGEAFAHRQIVVQPAGAHHRLLAPGMQRVDEADHLDALQCQRVEQTGEHRQAVRIEVIAQIPGIDAARAGLVACPLAAGRIGVGPGHARPAAAEIVGDQPQRGAEGARRERHPRQGQVAPAVGQGRQPVGRLGLGVGSEFIEIEADDHATQAVIPGGERRGLGEFEHVGAAHAGIEDAAGQFPGWCGKPSTVREEPSRMVRSPPRASRSATCTRPPSSSRRVSRAVRPGMSGAPVMPKGSTSALNPAKPSRAAARAISNVVA